MSANNVDKRQKTADLRKKHENVLAQDGGPGAKFFPKVPYLSPKKEMVVAFFPSELTPPSDVYTEFITVDYEPANAERKLWKLRKNPHFETEYEKTEAHPVTGHYRYLVPIAELVEVKATTKSQETPKLKTSKPETPTFDLPNPDDDSPLNMMTLRDKCAIEWQKPVSRKAWLNDLICETFNIDQ